MANDKPSGGGRLSMPGRQRMFRTATIRQRNGHYEMWIGTCWAEVKNTSAIAEKIKSGRYKLKGETT